jgi:chromosome segregation ATPase
MIRTLAEVHADRVTVTVTLDTEASAPLTIDAVQPAVDRDEVERLSRHVRELGDRCRAYDEDRTTERDRADRLQRELDNSQEASAQALNERNRLARRVAELERSLGNSIGRENRMETERAELDIHHRMSLEARDRLLGKATTDLARIREAVWPAHLDEPMENRSTIVKHAHDLAEAVRFVRAVTGQPSA